MTDAHTPGPLQGFRAMLASQYPGMSPEMRNGIVGLAVRAFITPVEINSEPIKYRTGMSEAEARNDAVRVQRLREQGPYE